MMRKQRLVRNVLLVLALAFNKNAHAHGDSSHRKPSESLKSKVALVLHGGAGVILEKNFTPELEQQYREALRRALYAGYRKLLKGESSAEAVKTSIVILEDSPLFNAGKGAVFTHNGKNSFDASIMQGDDQSAGALAGVHRVKNPILLADKIRTDSQHVMMTGDGAEEFAQQHQIELVDPKYFYTERRWKSLQKALGVDAEHTRLSLDDANNFKYGTVGVVALDGRGVITAGTSTGGMTNKRYGRVGDSPIIGAGTYANGECGVSATGHGEYFIRAVVTHDICALMSYKGVSLQAAADEVIHTKLTNMGGTGGVVGLDSQGSIVSSFNTPGMYRASIDQNGRAVINIFKDR